MCVKVDQEGRPKEIDLYGLSGLDEIHLKDSMGPEWFRGVCVKFFCRMGVKLHLDV
jgi:hypothetical protein